MSKYPGERIQGKVSAYSEAVQSGVLITEDRKTYLFTQKEWLSELAPMASLDVSFVPDKNWAKSVLLTVREPETRPL